MGGPYRSRAEYAAAWLDGEEAGRVRERRDIVTWLRARANWTLPAVPPEKYIADEIENGEHRKARE